MDFIDGIADVELGNRFKKFFAKMPKDRLEIFRLPRTLMIQNGLPEELYEILNVDRFIFDICKPFYIVLETIGFYRKSDTTLKDLGY